MPSNSGKPQWWCVFLSRTKMDVETLEEEFEFLTGGRASEEVKEIFHGFLWLLLLNHLALVVWFVGFREPDLWSYFESEKVCQAIFWTSMMLKSIHILACFVLTWKYGRRYTVLPALFWIVYMTGFAVGCYLSVSKQQN